MTSILRLDNAGNPTQWINHEDAAIYYAKDLIAWTLGDPFRILHGGVSRMTGERSYMDIHPVIAVRGATWNRRHVPALTNTSLFKRDGGMCMYCGHTMNPHHLTRDHVIPKAKGGKDTWTNAVAACKRCNNHKADRTPEQAGMPLLAVPYTPNQYEFMYLTGRNILADQMEFLRAGFHHLQA